VPRVGCWVVVVALLFVGCAEAKPVAPQSTTPCQEVVPECTAERLPNVILTGDQTSGALGSVGGFSLDSLIGFDVALRRGAEEGGRYNADIVQVTLGSADASENHWGEGRRLFYYIAWEGGLCGLPAGGFRDRPASPTCIPISAGTIIDALTGEFIVSGESSL
jgi:hypothetical protein